MRLRAAITIDIDAADFVEAADHQRRVETLMHHLRESYPLAEVAFRERRLSRRGKPAGLMPSRAAAARSTGNLKIYVD